MSLPRRSCTTSAGLLLAATPVLSGCGLLSGGTTAQDALEYVPADAFSVSFTDRTAVAERIGLDDVDPRDVGEDDLEALDETLRDGKDAPGSLTRLTSHLSTMSEAPFNDFDVEWEVVAAWGDDPEDASGSATIWKVGDEVDFGDLAEDLADKGYEKSSIDGHPSFSADAADFEEGSYLAGGVYPVDMTHVLLDEDEKIIVASAVDVGGLEDVAAVVDDDADSLADERTFDELVEAVDDPEIVNLVSAGPGLCTSEEAFQHGRGAVLEDYADVGRPDARALLVAGDAEVSFVLQYGSDDEAEDELEVREAVLEDGVDPRTGQALSEIGDFEVQRDGDLVVIEADYDEGLATALSAAYSGASPALCIGAATE